MTHSIISMPHMLGLKTFAGEFKIYLPNGTQSFSDVLGNFEGKMGECVID